MMGGTVVFTYKRRRFSNKPHTIEELQPDRTCNPQIQDLIDKANSQIESQKAEEPKVKLHKVEQDQIEPCKTAVPPSGLENTNQPFELQKIERSQIELLPKDELETEPHNELQNIDGNKIEFHAEIQIINEHPLGADNIDNCQNERQKMVEVCVELPEKDEHRFQKVDDSQIEPHNPESTDVLQCNHHKVCEPQPEQQIRDETQIEREKVSDEPEADISAKPQKQELLNELSQLQIEREELDGTQSDYPVQERAEEAHYEIQNFHNDPQKIHKLQPETSIKPSVADPSDELHSKLNSQTYREQSNEDSMEVDNAEDNACVVTISSSKSPTEPDRAEQEMNPELKNSKKTNNHTLSDEKMLSCDRDKPNLTSRQVRPIIDLTKLPMEAELENEMERLPPENISGSWKDKEVELLERLENDLKAKHKEINREMQNFDLQLAPDMLSLRPTFDQDILGTLRSQARPKSLSAGSSRFGLPFPSKTIDPKNRNVNSDATLDFFPTPGMRDSFEHMHKQVLENIYTGSRILQDKLKYNARTNDAYNTTSTYGTSSYKLHDWSEEELDFLWIGVRRYGPNNWDAVLRDPRFRFTKFKTIEDLAARWEVEQRRLFSCPLPVPVPIPPPRTTHWHSNLETNQLGDQYLEGSSYRAFSGRFWHQSMGSGMMSMPDMIPRRGRAKYQIRRAPKAQTVTRTPSPPISTQPSRHINNSKRDAELPHWLRQVTEAPLGPAVGAGFASKELLNRGTVKRKGMCDRVVSEPYIEPNFKLDGRLSFNSSKKQSLGPDKLVILDSDGASSEETLSA